MDTGVMFSKATDEWATPYSLFAVLDAEFMFSVDIAARLDNRRCAMYFGPDHSDAGRRDALAWRTWKSIGAVWCNPPYSRCAEFIATAARTVAEHDAPAVVMLVPSRTDTRWWHAHVWDTEKHQPRPGVEIRFIKGRLKFGEGKNSAPFPSVVIVFRPVEQ